jgi:TRAP-type C4-dicarboxylate transport system substrate-binding protein
MKKVLLLLFTIVVVSILIFGGCAEPTPTPAPTPAPSPAPAPALAPAPAEPVVIKLATFYPDVPGGVGEFAHMLIDKIHAKSSGAIKIDYVGGPEVVPPPDLPGAVARGTIDMAASPDPFVEGLSPGAGRTGQMDVTLEEFRKNGGFDYFNELYAKAGAYRLGSALPIPPNTMARIHLNKKVEKLADLDGLTVGCVSDSYFLWFKAMGMTGVTINMPDYFTAMERGTVDAVELGITGIPDFSLFEVIKYELDEPYGSTSISFSVNLDKWNALPQNLKDIMTEAAIEVEQEGPPVYQQLVDGVNQELIKAGAQFVKFSPEDEKKFYEFYHDAVWEKTRQDLKDHLEIADKLEELLRK